MMRNIFVLFVMVQQINKTLFAHQGVGFLSLQRHFLSGVSNGLAFGERSLMIHLLVKALVVERHALILHHELGQIHQKDQEGVEKARVFYSEDKSNLS